jgi:hypothetical protein
MSYAKNIARTMVESARSQTRQVTWAFNRKPSKIKRHLKLQDYLTRAGGNLFSIAANPMEMGVNVGWAGKKTKTKMMMKNTVSLGKKTPKVFRIDVPSITGFFFRRYLLRFCIMPVNGTGEDTAQGDMIYVDDFDKALFIRNHKHGTMTLSSSTGQSVTKNFIIDPTKKEDDILNAWSFLVRRKSTGETRPLIQPSLFKAATGIRLSADIPAKGEPHVV